MKKKINIFLTVIVFSALVFFVGQQIWVQIQIHQGDQEKREVLEQRAKIPHFKMGQVIHFDHSAADESGSSDKTKLGFVGKLDLTLESITFYDLGKTDEVIKQIPEALRGIFDSKTDGMLVAHFKIYNIDAVPTQSTGEGTDKKLGFLTDIFRLPSCESFYNSITYAPINGLGANRFMINPGETKEFDVYYQIYRDTSSDKAFMFTELPKTMEIGVTNNYPSEYIYDVTITYA
ncbi:MAG: hypothetical protein SOU05_06255 [Atopobium sp.]|uniref:hypothetical protein n=1 Tax=Atopobium sp. TaxID=1872650 RepID=UPI002A7654C5|nr:hypothetical protein [Atopobium sp.]MDY2788988.1 hypothetical protein [Atopobium sp.]